MTKVIDPETQAVSVPLAENIFVPKGDANARVRAAVDVAISTCGVFPGGREIALVKTKLEEAALWLSKVPAARIPEGITPLPR